MSLSKKPILLPTLLFTLLLMLLTAPFSHAAWENTIETEFSYSPRPIYDRINNQYLSVVTLTNQSSTTITGPFRVFIPTSSHQVRNMDGNDNGVPYVNLSIDELAAGASHKFTLQLELKRALIAFELINKVEVIASGTGLELNDDQIAIFYQRADGNYDGWGLHLWNGEGCGNYASPTTDSAHFSQWPSPYPVDGVHPEYGGYYILSVEPGADCYNFIIHKGNDKALGANNSRFEPVKATQGQQAFTFNGYPDIWYTPVTTRPVFLDGARVHWLDTSTLLWSTDVNNADSYRLYYVADASIDVISQALLNDLPYKTLTTKDANASYYQQNPHLNGFKGFTLDIDETQAKQLVKNQLLVVALDQQGNLLDATRVQSPRLLDYLYTHNSSDADEASLGLNYQDGQVTASAAGISASGYSLTQVGQVGEDEAQ